MRSNGTAPMQPASSACSTTSENRCQQSEFRASAPLSSLGPMAPLMVSRVRDISSHNEKHAGNKVSGIRLPRITCFEGVVNFLRTRERVAEESMGQTTSGAESYWRDHVEAW